MQPPFFCLSFVGLGLLVVHKPVHLNFKLCHRIYNIFYRYQIFEARLAAHFVRSLYCYDFFLRRIWFSF